MVLERIHWVLLVTWLDVCMICECKFILPGSLSSRLYLTPHTGRSACRRRGPMCPVGDRLTAGHPWVLGPAVVLAAFSGVFVPTGWTPKGFPGAGWLPVVVVVRRSSYARASFMKPTANRLLQLCLIKHGSQDEVQWQESVLLLRRSH